MFNKIKSIFFKKHKNITKNLTKVVDYDSFVLFDLLKNPIYITIKDNSNEKVLYIGTEKNKNMFVIDYDQALLLSYVLKDYYDNKSLKYILSSISNIKKEN